HFHLLKHRPEATPTWEQKENKRDVMLDHRSRRTVDNRALAARAGGSSGWTSGEWPARTSRLQSGMTFETRPGIEGAGRGKAQTLAQKGDLEQGAEAQAEQGRTAEEDEDEDGRRQGRRVDAVDERGGMIGRQKCKNGRLRRRRHHGRQRDAGNPAQQFRRRGLARTQAERGGPVSRTNRL